MKFVAVLYILAAVFLAASISHYSTRMMMSDRLNRISTSVMSEVSEAPADVQEQQFKIVRRYMIATGGPCILSTFIAAPGIAFLYGAVSSQMALRQGKVLSHKTKYTEMAAIFFILLVLVALGTPC